MPKAKTELRVECVRLRVEERKSIPEIQALTGASKGSLSQWLRAYPLTAEETLARKQTSIQRVRSVRSDAGLLKKDRGEESDLHRAVRANNLTSLQVGKISETAVLLRLLANGFTTFGPVFDGERADWLAEVPGAGRVVKIQVKTAHQGDAGLPVVSLRWGHSRGLARQYRPGDFDFLVGYSLFTDTAYVWTWDEVAGKTGVTICETAHEAWGKLRGVAQSG